MNKEKCPCSSNHCYIDNLNCMRGREHFNINNNSKEAGTLEEKVIMDLRKCGHLLHHNKELNTCEILSKFSREELNQLHELLLKFYNNI